MGFHQFVNTAQFSYTARDFKKNGGIYCLAPEGSREYMEFWAEEERRCREGYTCADTWITGRHYKYLNYAPMSKVDDSIAMKMYRESKSKVTGKIGQVTADKIIGLPRFYEVDYEWMHFKNIAWLGGEFMGVSSPGGKHICCGKTRGAGFSYKEASDGVYNYTFLDGSISYYFAALEAYLNVDGILNKVGPMLDWINDHCPEWRNNRQKHDTVMHRKASYIDDRNVERGTMSEIIGVAINDPNKTRGKRGRKITFEEAGSFKNLLAAYAIAEGSMKDNGIYVGQMSVFGTGGEEGADIEGLETMFNNPEAFNMLAFPNTWEPGMEQSTCGYFVPIWRMKPSSMDEEGNMDHRSAIESEKKERKVRKKAKDPKILDRYKAEYPFTPKEMFKRLRHNIFNVDECDKQIRLIESQSFISGMIRHGVMTRGTEGVIFNPKPLDVAKPIVDYPHSQKDDLSGCVSIVAEPFRDQKGHVPAGMYQIVVDPYYAEEAEDLTSLFSIQVWKQYNNIDSVDEGLKVAWFTGRRRNTTEIYQILFMLSDLYNAPIQSEIGGGGQGIIDYAKITKQLHKLNFEPDTLRKEYTTAAAMKNRSLFMNMPVEKKKMGLTYLADWHTQQRGSDMKGNPILNIHREYDLGFLREMRSFNGERNADRISAALIAQFMLKENAYQTTEHVKTNSDNFFQRKLFDSNDVSYADDSAIISLY